MQSAYVVRFRSGEAPELLAQAWRLRDRVFRETLGWEVPAVDRLEFDRFDRDALHVAAVHDGRVLGYWRALCTAGPYLLEESFRGMLGDVPPPKDPDVWEISRFAVSPDCLDRRGVGKLLALEIGRFGLDVGARRLFAVVEPGFGRFIRACGLPVTQDTEPLPVGRGAKGTVEAVLISLDLTRCVPPVEHRQAA